MGFDEPCFADDDEALCRSAFAAARSTSSELLAQGFATLPLPDAPFAEGGFPTPRAVRILQRAAGAPGLDGLPDHLPNYESARQLEPRAFRWR